MTTATKKMIQAIEYVVKPIGIGSNLALMHLLWAMVSGAFLPSRGAVHTALKLSGRTDEETRRGGSTLRTGQWQIGELITRWREWVQQQGEWEIKTYEGWYAVSCDVVVFPRLKLQDWLAKLYRGAFGRAVRAVGFGVIVDVGHYQGVRIPLLRQVIRCQNSEKSEALLQRDLLRAGAKALGEKGVFVHDAGVHIKEVQEAGIERYVIRLSKNCVARWPYLPKSPHGNRKYGEKIRPLKRKRKGVTIASTNDPTETTLFKHEGRTIEVKRWAGVVGDKDNVTDEVERHDIWVFLTHCTKSRLSLAQTWLRQPRPYFYYTWIDGLLNKYLWQQSRSLGCTVNLFLTPLVVGDCLSLDF